MSWKQFRDNVLGVVSDPSKIASTQQVADTFAIEYDACIKRGGDSTNKISLNSGNVELMKLIFNLELQNGLTHTTPYQLVTNMGSGVIAYWQTAILNNIIPIIPAPGSVANVAHISNKITDVGKWPNIPPIPPTNSYVAIVDSFILASFIHLSTLKGQILTTSLYPPVGNPGPGILPWGAYFVDQPPATQVVGAQSSELASVEQKIAEVPDSLSQEEIDDRTKDLNQLKSAANENYLEEDEYKKLLGYEINNQIPLSSPISITQKETDAILKLTDAKYNCVIGAGIVATARRDVGLIETGWDTIPGGTNMGGGSGFVARSLKKTSSGKVIYEAGRIDEMIRVAGLDNEQQFNSKGKGYEWCACAVISWWKSVGLQTPPGGTLVSNWVPWAIKNGLYSSRPVLGAAIIYKSGGSYVHIGIVSGIMPDGTIISIEGNASKQGFSARGICCREGVAWMRAIDGFVIPPGCQ
jgi:hypothetical protein